MSGEKQFYHSSLFNAYPQKYPQEAVNQIRRIEYE